jgi:hypothetical protein
MLINLLPDFLTVLSSADRIAAYHRYFDAQRRWLEPYWHNYVLDPNGPHFRDVVRMAALADRSDLRSLLERTDVIELTRQAERRCNELLDPDVDVDLLLMVGVGAANAGELVVDGRGIAFVCLEHFTSVANPETQGLGLDPELIPLWMSHEIAHAVRYTSPSSRSELRTAIAQAGGYYSYWDTGRHVPLREHLVNEGLAVHVSRAVSPGHAPWEYFGFGRRQYARVRELEAHLIRFAKTEYDQAALGLRLRYLSGGMSDDARMMDRVIAPERAGYYIGARLAEPAVEANGLAWSIRAGANELLAIADKLAETA